MKVAGTYNLAPCPFCGATADFSDVRDFGFKIECIRCGASTKLFTYHSDREKDFKNAAATWNTRVRTIEVLEVPKNEEHVGRG